MRTLNLHISLLLLALGAILAGCVTTGPSVRAIRDPETTLRKDSRIFIDKYRDVAISDRSAFSQAEAVAKAAGLRVVEKEDAEFVLFLNYRRGLRYNPDRDKFERTLLVHSSELKTQIRDRVQNFGVINVGVFATDGSLNRTAWEGSVEVEDFNNLAEVELSLRHLFEKFAEDFRGKVKGTPAP